PTATGGGVFCVCCCAVCGPTPGPVGAGCCVCVPSVLFALAPVSPFFLPDIAITITTAIAATAAPPMTIIRMTFLSSLRFEMFEPKLDIGSNVSDGAASRPCGALWLVSNSSGGGLTIAGGGSGAGTLFEPEANAGVPLLGVLAPMPFSVDAGDGIG